MSNLEITPAKDLARTHGALREGLNRLEHAAHAPRDAMPMELRNDLEHVRGYLLEHFRLEESNGYMNHVVRHAPYLGHRAGQLLQEHRALARALDTLVEEASGRQLAGPVLRDQVLIWIEQVRTHESRENLLAEEALNRDVGAEG